jgi:Tol biopolymer transport system component
VIHRDLKPANVKLTPEGSIKVLDLGLAKALVGETSGDPGSLSLSPTVTSAGTLAGTLLGTAAYMSPEQAKGRAVDRRADVWAFGCLLFEMLTGTRTFDGETVSETLASVLRDEVSWDALPEETPPSIVHLLRRCLDRNPRMRLRDIGEARVALSPESLLSPELGRGEIATSAAPAGPAGARLAWGLAAVALVAAAALGWLAVTRSQTPTNREEIRASIRPPAGQVFEAYGVHSGAVSISPDGMRMTFVSRSEEKNAGIYLRSLGSEEAQPLAGTEGATYPFWSPDGRQLGFFVRGKLKRVDLAGGAPMTVADAPEGRGASWNADGEILFAPDTQSQIHRVSVGGGTPTPVTTLDVTRGGETTHRFPFFLPDGRHFLYLRGSHATRDTEVNSIWVGSLDTDETFELMSSGSQAIYAQGHLFWVHDQFLMARPFDASSLEFTGEAFAVAEGIVFQETYWRAAFDVSPAGPIVCQTGLASSKYLAWFDRAGSELSTLGTPGQFDEIRLSPDDRFLAATIQDESTGRGDIWIFDVRRNVGSRLTFDDGSDSAPVWSPDGKMIAFRSNRGNTTGDIYLRPADGRGQAELLYADDAMKTPRDWSSDGKYLAIDHGVGKSDVWIVPLDGGDPFSLIVGDFDEGYSRFSPDGNWLGYISNESGRFELYMTRVPRGEGKWQLSIDGADWLIGWKRDGTEVYFLNLEGVLMSVKLELGDAVVADVPQRLFPTRAGSTWSSASDGERFVLGVPDDPNEDYPISLILDWNGKR